MTTYLDWAVTTFGYRPGDRMVATAPVCFDAAVRQLLAPLLAGATVVVVPRDVRRDPKALLRLVEDEQVTVWSSVPTLWAELLRAAERRATTDGVGPDLSRVRWVHVGGEALPPAQVRRWFDLRGPGCPVVNLYGPTEATINATYEVIGTRPPTSSTGSPSDARWPAPVVDVVAPGRQQLSAGRTGGAVPERAGAQPGLPRRRGRGRRRLRAPRRPPVVQDR
jgi:non-ribosomal peptide synthetase component F